MSERDVVAVHGALGAAQLEVAQLKAALEERDVDLASFVKSVTSLRATIERVRALAVSWETATPRLAELAETRSAAGDDSLTRALAIGRSYAVGLRAALEDPS